MINQTQRKNLQEELLLIVHPFSNKKGIYYLDKNFQDIEFSNKEQAYFERIKQLIGKDTRNAIITQPYWDYNRLKKYLEKINPLGKREILATHGKPYECDYPMPLIGWEQLIENLKEIDQERIVICGAQLGIWQTLFNKDHVGHCVGRTYNNLKKKIKNKNIRLERELCLVYDYR
jgi:hypothetical protein